MSCRVSTHFGHGQFHGTQSFLGLVAQQFQFRGTEDQERGIHIVMSGIVKIFVIGACFIFFCLFNFIYFFNFAVLIKYI